MNEKHRPLCTTKGCTTGARSLGWCNTHYEHWRRNDGRWPLSAVDLDPFWRNVRQDGECWLWQGSTTNSGYGKYGGSVLTHRHAYTAMVGEIPKGLQLDHLCRNKTCVNPDHLEPVTARVNVHRKDMSLGVGVGKAGCPRGHEYSADNTARRGGRRHCRACERERARRNRPRREELRRKRRAMGMKVT